MSEVSNGAAAPSVAASTTAADVLNSATALTASTSEGSTITMPGQNQQTSESAAKSTEVQQALEDKAADAGKSSGQDDKFAAKFAALSRKEKQLRDKERELETKLKDMESKFSVDKQEVEKLKAIPERLKKEPLKVMEEFGLTFQQLTEMMLNDGKPTPEMLLSEKETAIRKEIEALKKQIEDKEQSEQQKKYEEVLNGFVQDLTKFVSDTEDYEMIRASDAVPLVYEVIEAHHANTGTILSNKEACDLVEAHLLEEAKKYVTLNKIKGLLQPKEQTPAQSTEKRQASVTLSNTASAQVPKQSERRLSSEESLREAAKLIKWES